MFTQHNQHETLNLKAGDKAYYLVDEVYGFFDLVTITGLCEEGHGYSAISPWCAANYPPKEEGETPGSIHTCNNTLCKTKREAHAEALKLLKKSRKHAAEEQAKWSRTVQLIDHRLAGGK